MRAVLRLVGGLQPWAVMTGKPRPLCLKAVFVLNFRGIRTWKFPAILAIFFSFSRLFTFFVGTCFLR